MRRILFAIITLLGFEASGQVNVSVPQLTYVGEWQYNDLRDMAVGTKILFQQKCVPSLPEDVPNGVIMFRNVVHDGERFSVAVEFKDTVVECVTYYLAAKQDDLLPTLGFPTVEAITPSKKREWSYTSAANNKADFIVGNRKTITIISRRED